MSHVYEQNSLWEPTSDAERSEVLCQLDSIFESSYFRTSRRYPSLLRFVVERTLEGRAAELKERTLGIEIFKRELTYDTHQDPIVRVTAAEVRKRLGLYYQAEGAQDRIRIELASGSYVPTFQIAGEQPAAAVLAEPMVAAPVALAVAEVPAEVAEVVVAPVVPAVQVARRSLWLPAALAAVVVLLAACGYLANRAFGARSQNAFWQPLLNDRAAILLCAPSLSNLHTSVVHVDPTPQTNVMDAFTNFGQMSFADALTQTRLGSFLGRVDHEYRVQSSDVATYTDMQSGPVVLIGALSNPWTMRLTANQRFYFQDEPGFSRIIDRDAKTPPGWQIEGRLPYTKLVSDYALVARFRDPSTQQFVIIAAGLGTLGTEAAGNFVTDKNRTDELLAKAPAGWGKTNVAAILQTEVINGISGPPRIIATQFW